MGGVCRSKKQRRKSDNVLNNEFMNFMTFFVWFFDLCDFIPLVRYYDFQYFLTFLCILCICLLHILTSWHPSFWKEYYTEKRLSIFPAPDGMSLTKLSLAGNYLIIPAWENMVSDIPAGNEKIYNLFLQCSILEAKKAAVPGLCSASCPAGDGCGHDLYCDGSRIERAMPADLAWAAQTTTTLNSSCTV